MAIRDQFVHAASLIAAAMVGNNYVPDTRDEDFSISRGGDYIVKKHHDGRKEYVRATYHDRVDGKVKKYKMVTDMYWRVSREACELAASIVDISAQYSFPDEAALSNSDVGYNRKRE